MSVRKLEFINTMIEKPQSDCKYECERYAEGPLCAEFAVWRITAAVKDEEPDDEYALIGELAPSLHGEGEKDISATMHSVSQRVAVTFHRASTCHRIFAAHAKAVKGYGDDIHHDPSLQCRSPHRSKKNRPYQHDNTILNQPHRRPIQSPTIPTVT